jgi:surface carbohydrate biosynthesis protein
VTSPPRMLPTLFVPIEVKVREFAPKLLLSAVAAERGWRVYLGSKVAVTAAIHSRAEPRGVYFAKGGDREDVLVDAKHRCQRLVVQDEEIGPGMTPDEVEHAWRTRYSERINALVDRVFLYADEHLESMAAIFPDLAARSVVTGWPRFDLWRPGFRRADETRALELRATHGDFVLFNSRFKVTTPEQRARRIEMAREAFERLPPAARDDRLAHDEFGSKATERYEAFLRGVDVLRRMFDDPDMPALVVRPHPAEDPQAWRAAFVDHPRVRVAAEGEVGPWILASRAMLHTASTTALQAQAYGVPAGFLAEVGYPPDGAAATESYRASTPLADTASARAFVRAHPPRPLGGDRLDTPPEEPLIAERIVDELATLPVEPEPAVPIRAREALGSRIDAGYHRWKRSRWSPAWLTPSFYGTNAQPKLAGGLPAREARRFLDTLPLDVDLEVRAPRANLLRIERRSARR